MKNRNINIITLGCSKNIVDSEKLLRQIEEGGYKVFHNSPAKSAGTVIINTCGFINDAKEESIDTILKYARDRESGKIENLFVMGCLAERYKEVLGAEIPEVSRYFGVNNMADVLNELGIGLRDDLLTERKLSGPGHFAYLKIAEGCDRTCAFCAIPGIRGKYTSAPVQMLMQESRILASKGVKELILIAQDLSYYGLDSHKKQVLPELVSKILTIRDFEWIRLHYLYPANFPFELIPLFRDNPALCRYIDIPVQHISDRMLKLMRRSHGRDETMNVLTRLRNEIPGAAIRTTLIAGHPGETEKDFYELKEFITAFRFDRLGVFAYSHEEDTWSYNNYADEIPAEIKEQRVAELMEIQQSISLELNREMIGKSLKVIIDRREGEYYIGRTEFDSPEVDQEVLIEAHHVLKQGEFALVRITGASEFDLFGEPDTKKGDV